MMKLIDQRISENAQEVRILGMIVYARIGNVSVGRILGWNLYKRVGDVRSFLGIAWARHAA